MKYSNRNFDEERALYGISDAEVTDCSFDGPADGESAMKECTNLTVDNCFFNLRYPFWHVNHAVISNSHMTDKCRAALWYDRDIKIRNSKLHGIKALRECCDISLNGCDVISPEFFWRCHGLDIKNTSISSEYPFFECTDIVIDSLSMTGKYSFQYTENVVIRNSVLKTKDAFWHSKNVTVIDSTVSGEYLGWYSENLHLIRCHISGTQPLCYCRGLVLEDCTTDGADLAFEYSEVKATIKGSIDSVKNPVSGSIEADTIGEIIWDSDRVDKANTNIKVNT